MAIEVTCTDRDMLRFTSTTRPQGWNQLGADIDGDEQNDKSGTAVSLSADGTRVAIGAPGAMTATPTQARQDLSVRRRVNWVCSSERPQVW